MKRIKKKKQNKEHIMNCPNLEKYSCIIFASASTDIDISLDCSDENKARNYYDDIYGKGSHSHIMQKHGLFHTFSTCNGIPIKDVINYNHDYVIII